MNSPSFVTGADVAPPAHVALEDVDDGALDAFLAARPTHRVGRYFEALLQFWLADICGYEIVAAGQQIKDGKRTVGELDFVYRDDQGSVVHCEASVKFFLHHPRPATSHFPGPNATDNYERKMSRLFDHQLPLSHEHWPEVNVRHAFVKGMVFWRNGVGPTTPTPDRMPADPLTGRWLRARELNSLRDHRPALAAIANKPHWLAPPPPERAIGVDPACDLLMQHFATGAGYPMMVSLLDASTGDECERLFVVSDSWPGS